MKLVKKDENLSVKFAFERYQRSNKIKKLSEMTIDLKDRNFYDLSKFINVDEYNIKNIDLDLIEEYIESLIDKWSFYALKLLKSRLLLNYSFEFYFSCFLIFKYFFFVKA